MSQLLRPVLTTAPVLPCPAMPAQANEVPLEFASACCGATPALIRLLPGSTLAIVGSVLALFLVSVEPSLVAVTFWLIAVLPPIARFRLCAVDCDVAAAPNAGATASAETVAAPMMAANFSALRFKTFPPEGAPHLGHRQHVRTALRGQQTFDV